MSCSLMPGLSSKRNVMDAADQCDKPPPHPPPLNALFATVRIPGAVYNLGVVSASIGVVCSTVLPVHANASAGICLYVRPCPTVRMVRAIPCLGVDQLWHPKLLFSRHAKG